MPHEHFGPSQVFRRVLKVGKSIDSFRSEGILFQSAVPAYLKEYNPQYVVLTFGWYNLDESRRE